jgi:hypothetical protein
MNDELDMSGNNINMNGGAVNGLTLNTLALNNGTLATADSTLTSNVSDGSVAYGTLTTSDPSQSIFIYRGILNNSSTKHNFIMGSPTRIPMIIYWGGNSSGGDIMTITSTEKRSSAKLGSILIDADMQGQLDRRMNWRPPANGFISTVCLYDLGMHFEFTNNSSVSHNVTMEIWIIDTYEYTNMLNGDETPKGKMVGSKTWNIPNNGYTGSSYTIEDAAPYSTDGIINLTKDKYIYFEGGSGGNGGNSGSNTTTGSLYPAVIFRAPSLNSGTIEITPMPQTSNNGFTSSGVDVYVHMQEKVFI